MSELGFSLILLLALFLINGLLSMTEMAIVSARRARLQQRADEGDAAAKAALSLAESPGSLLSTVQIGITLIGILTGAISDGALISRLAEWFKQVPGLATYSSTIAGILVFSLVTFVSIVVGELAPKQIALLHAESIAKAMAPAMHRIAQLTSPLVHLLNLTTDFILRIFGIQATDDPTVSEDDVRHMLEQGAEEGVFEQIEEEIVGQVFRLSDLTVSALLTPRTDIIWLDLHDSQEEVRAKIIEHRFAQFPVADGDLDTVVGVVLSKDLLVQSLSGQSLDLSQLIRQPLFIPESTPALEIFEKLKETGTHIAFVIDEYGGLEGLVTLDDLFEAMVGELPNSDPSDEVEEVQREDGSWLLDGMYAIDEFKEKFHLDALPDEEEGYYQTLGGFMMRMLEKVPTTGDKFEWEGLRLEVVDMDGRRVDKVLIENIEQKA